MNTPIVKPEAWDVALPKFEGSIPHIYPDSNGLQTCGTGHLLATRNEALIVFSDPRAGNDWDLVKAAPGHRVAYYADITSCRLTDEQSAALKKADIARVRQHLYATIFDASTFPECVQDVCLDIIFQTGGLRFPNMLAAIRRKDWVTAANETFRPDAQALRNDWARDCMLWAAQG